MLRSRLLGGMVLLGLMLASWFAGRNVTAKEEAADPAVERTRQTVKMLDDLYKTAVVLITDKYVHSKDDFPAGSAAVALFGAMKKKGWHDVRLVDATNDPLVEKNAPQDDFEKAAVKALVGGKPYYEQIVKVDGKDHLRAATPVPVVSKKCIMCHDQYASVKEGQPIGIISYNLKVQ